MLNSEKVLDVVIVGAGLSGIDAAYHIQASCPNRSFAILEGRGNIGGTWDFFKYPGIRSDSDMYTFGFPFYPWKNPKAIADGSSILKYINDAVDEFDLRKKIQFNRRVTSASWSSEDKNWELTVTSSETGEHEIMRCKFLFMCSGYYDYRAGHTPAFPNSDAFKGITVHPQKWDTSLDYSDKKIVIIGSGATAVTLVPVLAKTAKSVTMLQRSPTYIMNLPSEDVIANFLKRVLPSSWAHHISRWKNILISLWFYQACRKWPDGVAKFLKSLIKKSLRDKYDDKHFNPKYDPWDQRLCLVPDNDLFRAITKGKATIVTDTIKKFTKNGIELDSGNNLDADIIVTATGLKVQLFGGMALKIDGKPIDMSNSPAFKGVLLSDVPNFGLAVGYTNASWTLKSDLSCQYVTKVLNLMEKKGYEVCTPRFPHETMEKKRLLDFDAGYIMRANDILPKQGTSGPWKVEQNYIKDLISLGYGSAKDKYLEYV
ncbi:MAG: monooxygenase [Bacteroidia bacterium]|jgi:cation diffusion facilitator CzcD-associated flavoprotein CzcO